MQKIICFIIIFAFSVECHVQEPTITAIPQPKDHITIPDTINMNAYTTHKINSIIKNISNNKNLEPSKKISLISSKFLKTPYKSNTLYGSENVNEILSIDFNGVDCVTYLDYAVALYLSHSQNDFLKNIIKIRYIDNNISFYNRRHFFTDWANRNDKIADDITSQLSSKAINHIKLLNKKSDGQKYLPGIPIISRNISYIPSSEIDNTLVNKFKNGDLIGIYTPLPGLDVSHVGFVILTEQGPVFRHASSSKHNACVVDTPLLPYLLKSPGIIVLRIKSIDE